MAATNRYKADYARQVETLCTLGATDPEIAAFFDVPPQTIHTWAHAHPAFAEALTIGKAAADDRVERSLYHRAVGYDHDDVHISTYQGQVTVTPLRKHLPPDPRACIFWLKNRRTDRWSDKQEHEHSGKDGGPIEMKDAPTPREMARRVAFLLAEGLRLSNTDEAEGQEP